MLISNAPVSRQMKEHDQELVHIPGRREMICAGQSRSVDMLNQSSLRESGGPSMI